MNKLALPLLIGLLMIPSVALARGLSHSGDYSHHRFKRGHFSGHHLRLIRGRHFKHNRHYSHPRHGRHYGHYRSHRPYYGHYGRHRHWHYRYGHRWFRRHGRGGHSYFFRHRR